MIVYKIVFRSASAREHGIHATNNRGYHWILAKSFTDAFCKAKEILAKHNAPPPYTTDIRSIEELEEISE